MGSSSMRFILTFVLLAGGGCYSPKYHSGDLKCAAGPTPCPDGYHCAITHTCWKNGHEPPRLPGHFAPGAGGAVNITSANSHHGTLSIGQPLAGAARSSSPTDHTIEFGIVRDTVTH